MTGEEQSNEEASKQSGLPREQNFSIDAVEFAEILKDNDARDAQIGRCTCRGLGKTCSWCAPDITTSLPTAFCWTKMQAESGQNIEHIIRRKDLERQNGVVASFEYQKQNRGLLGDKKAGMFGLCLHV
jgi:hypothetical protein